MYGARSQTYLKTVYETFLVVRITNMAIMRIFTYIG